MKINEKITHALINDLYHPLTSRRNNLLYKNYIYNLFRYNQDTRKKLYEKDNEEQKFNVCIRSINSPKIDDLKKSPLILSEQNKSKNKNKNFTPKNLKKLNINSTNKIRYPNSFSKNRKSRYLTNYTYENNHLSRNIKIDTNYSSFYGLLENSKKNSFKKLNEKYLFLRPIPRRNIKKEFFKNNFTENMTNNISNKSIKEKDNKSKVLSSSYCKKKKNNILNKTNNYFTGPSSPNKTKKKIKLILFRDVNDMEPRNRFNILRKELLEKDNKINKMLMKFQKNTKKKLLNKWLKLFNKSRNSNSKFPK